LTLYSAYLTNIVWVRIDDRKKGLKELGVLRVSLNFLRVSLNERTGHVAYLQHAGRQLDVGCCILEALGGRSQKRLHHLRLVFQGVDMGN
jgi:hypothetical protein